MREIVLDTETTGLDPEQGDRVVEIGAVELFNHLPTGKTYHQYINPKRDMPDDAFRVHGLSAEFLSDKPEFSDIADAFLDFIGDSKLVIHNASFDMRFLNAELGWARLKRLEMTRAIDTVGMARRKFPGSPASLDALCRRFGIDNSARTLHGALLDSEILAEVYLELIGGRQPDFGLSPSNQTTAQTLQSSEKKTVSQRKKQLSSRLSETESDAHDTFVKKMGDQAIWLQI